MATVITFTNRKGGTAKTTTTACLGVVLAEMGYKVLMIDLDFQGNLSITFGYNPFTFTHPNIYEVLIDGKPIRNVVESVKNNLDLVTSDDRLDDAEEIILNRPRREDYLKRSIQAVANEYDFILLDCHPGTGIFTQNAFSASQYTVIPMSAEFLAMVGVGQALVKIATKGKVINPDLEVLGVLVTRYDTRNNESAFIYKSTKDQLQNHFRVFDTYIREGIGVKRAPRFATTIVEQYPESDPATDYKSFAEELLKYVQK